MQLRSHDGVSQPRRHGEVAHDADEEARGKDVVKYSFFLAGLDAENGDDEL